MRSPCFARFRLSAVTFSGNASPQATIFTALSASREFWQASPPRPPQPMTPTLMVSSAEACTAVGITAAAAIAAPVARKSRRFVVFDSTVVLLKRGKGSDLHGEGNG